MRRLVARILLAAAVSLPGAGARAAGSGPAGCPFPPNPQPPPMFQAARLFQEVLDDLGRGPRPLNPSLLGVCGGLFHYTENPGPAAQFVGHIPGGSPLCSSFSVPLPAFVAAKEVGRSLGKPEAYVLVVWSFVHPQLLIALPVATSWGC